MSNNNNIFLENYLKLVLALEDFFKNNNQFHNPFNYANKLIRSYEKITGRSISKKNILYDLLSIIKDNDEILLSAIYSIPKDIDIFKKFKKLSFEYSTITKFDYEIKNSDDAIYIYKMILKSQKIFINRKNINDLKKTDFLEKLLYSYWDFFYWDFLKNSDLSNLRQFIEYSVNPVLTTGALINYYDSSGFIGYGYLKDFAFNSFFLENRNRKNQKTRDYFNPKKFYNQINASVNILTDSGKASGVVYKINKKNFEVIIITNAHVIDNANEVNVQFVNDIEIKWAHYLSFKDKKEIDIGIIVLKMEKDEIDKLKEPKIYDNLFLDNINVLMFGNSMGFGSTDKSTNMTQGKIFKIKNNEILIKIPSFPGNSGCGIFNKEGKLIGIHHAGEKQMSEALEEKNPDENNIAYRKFNEDLYGYTFGITIKAAKEAADELISEYYTKQKLNIDSFIYENTECMVNRSI